MHNVRMKLLMRKGFHGHPAKRDGTPRKVKAFVCGGFMQFALLPVLYVG